MDLKTINKKLDNSTGLTDEELVFLDSQLKVLEEGLASLGGLFDLARHEIIRRRTVVQSFQFHRRLK